MRIEQRTFIDLESVGSNNWLDQLGKEIPGFNQLCEIVGVRFVAFAFISGIRVSAINYNRENPEGSLVDYYDEDGKHVQQIRLSAFRERLTNALLADTQQPANLPERPTVSDVRLFVGHKYLLLAPVFGITVLGFYYGGARPPSVFLEIGDSEEELSVNGFRDVLEESVRSELSRSRADSAFSIDFKNIPQAEAANAIGDYKHTIEILGSWPGPLSMFLRTQEGQMLGEMEKATLAHALGILGKAYLETRQTEWAEDVLRLGVQWGQDSDRVGELFLLLAQARLSDERYGEAIGLLRRAMVVGASKLVVLPQLARCYAKRKRYVAAAICIDEAISNDIDPESIKEIRDEVHQVLGDAYREFRKKVPLEKH